MSEGEKTVLFRLIMCATLACLPLSTLPVAILPMHTKNTYFFTPTQIYQTFCKIKEMKYNVFFHCIFLTYAKSLTDAKYF